MFIVSALVNKKAPSDEGAFCFFTCSKKIVGNGLCAIPFFRNDTQAVPYEINIGFLFCFNRSCLGGVGVKLVLAVSLAEHKVILQQLVLVVVFLRLFG